MATLSLRRAARALSCVAAMALSWTAIADDAFDITRVAPPKAAAVLTIPSFAKFHASFENSELAKLWNEPGIQALVEELTAEASAQLGEFLKEIGAESKDLKPPTGGAGIALYMPPVSKEKPDHAGPPPAPTILLGADAGENAAAWKDLIEKLIDKGVKDKQFTSDEDTIAGTKATVLHPIYNESNEEPAARHDQMNDEEDGGPLVPRQPGFARFVGGSPKEPGSLTIAWVGSTIVASTGTKAMEHALDSMQGRETESLASDALFKAAAEQHPADTQVGVYLNVGVLLSQAFEEMLAERAGLEEGGGGPDPTKLFETLGLSQVKYISAGLRLDTPRAVTEMSIGVLAPEKTGLLAMVTDAAGAFDPPAFVPPDAASVTRLSFRFDKIYDLLQQVAATLPEEEGKQFRAGLDQSVNLIKPGVDALGPGVWAIGTYKQPLEADSQLNLFAVDVKDQAVVSNTLSFFVSQAQGLAESREFEGNTIYTAEVLGISVGLGFNRLFVGQTPAVENAMRLAGRPDAPRISAERGFKDATGDFGPDSVVQSYSDTAQSVRWLLWTAQNADKIALAQFDDPDVDPQQREQFAKRLREDLPKWLDKLPPIETILRHIGDSAMEIHPTPDGFRGRSLMLRPSGN